MRTSRLEGPAVMGTALQLAIEPARFFEFEAGGGGRTLGSLIWAMNAMPTRGLTVPLRTSYAQEVSELAVKAERDHGVPAPILAAMAVDQSGYGTIRVALAANII